MHVTRYPVTNSTLSAPTPFRLCFYVTIEYHEKNPGIAQAVLFLAEIVIMSRISWSCFRIAICEAADYEVIETAPMKHNSRQFFNNSDIQEPRAQARVSTRSILAFFRSTDVTARCFSHLASSNLFSYLGRFSAIPGLCTPQRPQRYPLCYALYGWDSPKTCTSRDQQSLISNYGPSCLVSGSVGSRFPALQARIGVTMAYHSRSVFA